MPSLMNTANPHITVRNWEAPTLLILLTLIWSSSYLFIKFALVSIPPLSLTTGRMLIAAIIMLCFAKFQGHAIPRDPMTWIGFLFLGVFANALPFSLIHFGELQVDSGLTAILVGIMPLAVAILAHFFASEPLHQARLFGVILGLSGLVVLVGFDVLQGLGVQVLAQLAIITGALCYAMSTIFVRRAVKVSGVVMSAGSLSIGSIIMLPLALYREQACFLWQAQICSPEPSLSAVVAMFILGVFPTALASVMYFKLIKIAGATYFAQVNYLAPLFGVLWGFLFLSEQPGWNALSGLILILTGVFLVNRKRS